MLFFCRARPVVTERRGAGATLHSSVCIILVSPPDGNLKAIVYSKTSPLHNLANPNPSCYIVSCYVMFAMQIVYCDAMQSVNLILGSLEKNGSHTYIYITQKLGEPS